MPTGNIVRFQGCLVALFRENAVIRDNSIAGLSQVGMSVKAGVEKCHSHAAPGESFISVHAQRRRQNKVVLVKDACMRFNLSLSTRE